MRPNLIYITCMLIIGCLFSPIANVSAVFNRTPLSYKNLPCCHDSSMIAGIMICDPFPEAIETPSSYDMTGCKMGGYSIPIIDFFESNKKKTEYEIFQVIYDVNFSKIFIYYGEKHLAE